MRRLLVSMLAAGCLVALASTVADAQQPAAAAPAADESEELAKKLSNPISDLVSVPFQFNWYQHVGPLELSTFILNVQPVIPLQLNEDWNLILRIIVPFIGQPPLFNGGRLDVRRRRHDDVVLLLTEKQQRVYVGGRPGVRHAVELSANALAADITASARRPSRCDKRDKWTIGILCEPGVVGGRRRTSRRREPDVSAAVRRVPGDQDPHAELSIQKRPPTGRLTTTTGGRFQFSFKSRS